MGLDPRETTKRLIDLALRGGAPDNVTCVIGDIVALSEDVSTQPVIVGAAAEPPRAGQTAALPQSPAEKAAALTRQAIGYDAAPEEAPLALPSRRWLRGLLVAIVLVGALALASYGGWRWSQTQLYVGQSGGQVALYRGVPQTLGPWKLGEVQEVTDIEVGDLPQMWRDRLDGQIRPTDDQQAKDKLAEIRRDAQDCRAKRAQGVACGTATT